MADLSNVYDFYCPSPPPLKDLVCMKIAMDLWRQEIQQHITPEGTLRVRSKKTYLKFLITDLRIPSTIVPKIEDYLSVLMENIPDWLKYHSRGEIFKMDILNHFTDFVCDFDGKIHYEKTAKRFMACDRISNETKFRLACEYCMEDDIVKLWPRVSTLMTGNEIEFGRHPNLHYWVSRLRNELFMVRMLFGDFVTSIEELFLEELYKYEGLDAREWPAVKYFLNHLPWNSELKDVAKMLNGFESAPYNIREGFFRYIWPKLNETEFKKLARENGDKLMIFAEPPYVLRIWARVKNEITNDGFCRLFEHILKEQTENDSAKDLTPHWAELWACTPDRLKRVAIRRALLVADSSCFERPQYDGRFVGDLGDRKSVSFLLAVLSDTPIEDRKQFWNKHGVNIICGIKTEDLRLLLNLCFNSDENQITRFKTDLVSKYYPKIKPHLNLVLEHGHLKHLDELLALICPNEDTVMEIRLKLLKNNLSGQCSEPILEGTSLNEFIDKAYENPVLATEFKNKLLTTSDSAVIVNLKRCIFLCQFRRIIDFLRTFPPSVEVALEIKKREIVPALKDQFTQHSFLRTQLVNAFDEFENFLKWLFETSEEIKQFKRALNMDAFTEALIQEKRCFYATFRENGVDYDWFYHSFTSHETKDPESVFRKLLKWYFVTPEAVENFVKKYRHRLMFNRIFLL